MCAVPDFSICSHRSFLPPRPAAAMGRTSSSLRYPQVLCVISQYPWFSFYYKILQVTEQLLKQDSVLNTYSKQQLAQNHLAGIFLTDLCHQCPQAPIPGKIIRSVTTTVTTMHTMLLHSGLSSGPVSQDMLCRVHYPKLDFPLSISPPKRIGWTEGADQLLTRCASPLHEHSALMLTCQQKANDTACCIAT